MNIKIGMYAIRLHIKSKHIDSSNSRIQCNTFCNNGGSFIPFVLAEFDQVKRFVSQVLQSSAITTVIDQTFIASQKTTSN